jgi:hypothetical protein
LMLHACAASSVSLVLARSLKSSTVSSNILRVDCISSL